MSSKRIKTDTTQIMEFIPSELDLFTTPPIQTSILNETIIPYYPLTTLDKCSSIQFQINSFQDKYIDMNSIYLKLQIQLVKDDGTSYFDKNEEKHKENQAFIINNMLHSIFKSLSVEMNGQVVSSTQLYHYKSYLEDLLNYQKGRADSLMQCQGFYLDTAGNFDNFDKNTGASSRFAKTKFSKTFELYGKIHCDVFNQQKLLISDVDLKLNFDLEKKEFYLKNQKDANNSELKICEAAVFVRYLTISTSMLLAHHKMLQSSNIPYNFKRTVMKNFLIPSGVNSYNLENVFSGQLPTNLLIMFLENDAYNGSFSKSPFNFQHFHLTHLQLNVNGQNVPNYALTQNPNAGHVARSFHDLHLGLNHANKDFGLMFNEFGYRNGYTLYCFNLSVVKKNHVINLNNDTGILKAEIKFNTTLTSPVVMLVYGEFNSSFEVTSSKTVLVNY